MAFTPNSRVYLLDTPLDNKYKHQIHFETLDAQRAYFESCIKHSYEGVTFQRKDNVIRVENHIDYLWDSNYVMYQNTQYGAKWFYAFITKMEYVNDRTTDVYIETDVYQTWLFNTVIKPSFVVREHVADDTIGKHLLDEGLATGEYTTSGYLPSNKMGLPWNILAVSDNSPMGNSEISGNMYSGVVTGLTYYPFPNNTAGIDWLKDTIAAYTAAGKADAIVMIFTVPKLVGNGIPALYSDWFPGQVLTSTDQNWSDTLIIDKKLDNVGGYVPRNNKLYTYPYKFLYMTNGGGQSAQYRYENFPNTSMEFNISGTLMPNPPIMIKPVAYKGDGSAVYEEGLILEGFPLCSWTTDMYAAWFAQNSASTAVALVGTGAAIVGGMATGNMLALGGGILGISRELAEIYKATIQPDQAKGQAGSGSLLFGDLVLDFRFTHFSIKAEFAKRIDDFFTMYGYKVNTLKVPEIHSRQNWNYVQTIDINIDGTLPAEDMNRLKRAYDEGITLWHTTSGFLNYDLPNPII